MVAAGGVNGVAIRRDYGGYHGDNASTAAFIKAERWIVKIRVSGPTARRGEVMAGMDALLGAVRFGVATPPRPAQPLAIAECPPGGQIDPARELPDPSAPENAAHVFLATFDGGGIAATEQGRRNDLPPRVPRSLCLSVRASAGPLTVPILRGEDGPPISIDGRTRLLAPLGDSGVALEVVHAANLERYWLLFHEIGQTTLIRSYDAVPSNDQVVSIVNDLAAGRLNPTMRVRLRPDGQHQMFLPGPPQATGQ